MTPLSRLLHPIAISPELLSSRWKVAQRPGVALTLAGELAFVILPFLGDNRFGKADLEENVNKT